ncbi:hypothetical protein [Cobetia sp. 1AS1]|uniref:hypothetical protein n=1 Tax=Cobetia sp. 1AS1 TaxID=3040016 RepID=UPI00244A5991|nr:hypothetical protein [Cobetia sp. 1AS1]MDH2294248.1 hypothetical protein [Cobetia sp. 1AS1]
MKVVIGPSHVVRWVREHSLRQTDNALQNIKVIAAGGLPLWSDYVSKELTSIPKGTQIYVLVGDFRFGNEACDNPDNLCPPSMYGISKAAISSKSDKICYDKTLKALDDIVARFNVKFIFWDLAIREYKNKLLGRYINESGVYTHPIWNLSVVENRYIENIIPMQLIIDAIPDFLEMDSSNHPTSISYTLLDSLLLQQKNVSEAIVGTLKYYNMNCKIAFPRRTIFSGVSSLYRNIALYEAKRCVHIVDVDILSAEDAMFNKFRSCSELVYFANDTTAHSLRFLRKSKYDNILVVVRQGMDVLTYKYYNDEVISLERFSLLESHVEITGEVLNLTGVMYLLRKIRSLMELVYE